MPQLLQAQICIQTELPQTPPIFWSDQDIDRHNSLPGRLRGTEPFSAGRGSSFKRANLCCGIRLGLITDGRYDFGK